MAHREGKYITWFLVILVSALCTGVDGSARAFSFDITDIIAPTHHLSSDYQPEFDLTEIYKPLALELPGELTEIEESLQILIYFENLSDYTLFNPKLKGTVPLTPLARLLYVSSVRDPNYPLQMYILRERSEAVIPKTGFRFMFLAPRLEGVGGLSYISDPAKLRNVFAKQKDEKYNFFEWITDDANFFSGSPWTWDNALQRLLAMAGFVIVALLGTEGLRYLLGSGKRKSNDR